MNTSIFFNNFNRLFTFALVSSLGVFGASSSFADPASSTSSATVIVPIAISKSADLLFGKFAPGTGGSVTVSTSGARTASGAILSTIGSSPSAARFDVTGDTNATYSITWSGVTALTSGVDTMALTRISDLTAGGTTSGEVTSGTLTNGAQSIYLGGVLSVTNSQAAGTYTGDVTVAVEYN